MFGFVISRSTSRLYAGRTRQCGSKRIRFGQAMAERLIANNRLQRRRRRDCDRRKSDYKHDYALVKIRKSHVWVTIVFVTKTRVNKKKIAYTIRRSSKLNNLINIELLHSNRFSIAQINARVLRGSHIHTHSNRKMPKKTHVKIQCHRFALLILWYFSCSSNG